MLDRRRWTVVYVESSAARMTTTEDGGGWSRRRSGCSRKDTVTPDRAGIGLAVQSRLVYYVCQNARCKVTSQLNTINRHYFNTITILERAVT